MHLTVTHVKSLSLALAPAAPIEAARSAGGCDIAAANRTHAIKTMCTIPGASSSPQVLLTDSGSRLLLCAPSNSAADQLAERMLKEKGTFGSATALLRVNAYQRPLEDSRASAEVHARSNWSDKASCTSMCLQSVFCSMLICCALNACCFL